MQLNATGSDVVEDLEAIANANEKMRIETLESPNVNIKEEGHCLLTTNEQIYLKATQFSFA